MNPTTPPEWIAIAIERAADAEALKLQNRSIGAVYMAGYAIECSLKAYLQRLGKPVPAYGAQGHNLKALWKASGFHFCDLPDTEGEMTFYIESWNTELRYEFAFDFPLPSDSLIEGAKRLTGIIHNRIRRQSSIHRRKKL